MVTAQGFTQICLREIAGHLKCSCNKTCSTSMCSCFKNKFKCTVLCKCGDDCENHEGLVTETDMSAASYSNSESGSEE